MGGRLDDATGTGIAWTDADPDPALADRQRRGQPQQEQYGGEQGGLPSRVLGDLEVGEAGDPVEGDTARHVGQGHGLADSQGPSEWLAVDGHLGQARLVEPVDRLRDTTVQAEVAGIRGQHQLRVEGAGEGRARPGLGVELRRGQEEPLEGELGGLGVRRLEHPFGGQVAVERQKYRGAGEHQLTAAVANGDPGGVTVAGQEDLRPIDLQRAVDLDHPRLGGSVRPGDVDVGPEVPGRASLRPDRLERCGEPLERERERCQPAVPHAWTGRELVVLRSGVGERTTLDHDHPALEAEQGTGSDRWKSRFPASRRYPFSARTVSASTRTRNRRRRSSATAAARTWVPCFSLRHRSWPASRVRYPGARGGSHASRARAGRTGAGRTQSSRSAGAGRSPRTRVRRTPRRTRAGPATARGRCAPG